MARVFPSVSGADWRKTLIVPGDTIEIRPGIADFVIYPTPAELPKQGVMGILLEQSEDGVLAGKVFSGSMR